MDRKKEAGEQFKLALEANQIFNFEKINKSKLKICEKMKIPEIYNKLSVNYWLTALIISGIIFSIYLFFLESTKVWYFPFSRYTLLISASSSILIGCEYALIKYFYSNVHQTFGKLNSLFQKGQYQLFSQDLQKKFRKSWLSYLTIVVVLIPVVIPDLLSIFSRPVNGPYFFLTEPDN
jgi:hypothetical protein